MTKERWKGRKTDEEEPKADSHEAMEKWKSLWVGEGCWETARRDSGWGKFIIFKYKIIHLITHTSYQQGRAHRAQFYKAPLYPSPLQVPSIYNKWFIHVPVILPMPASHTSPRITQSLSALPKSLTSISSAICPHYRTSDLIKKWEWLASQSDPCSDSS